MKYANSLKYVNSFDIAKSLSELSQKRVRELCLALGRIHVGPKFIVVPAGCAGHASAVMLESVIKSAGYRVGRITSDSDFDSRTMVYLDSEISDIEDYNKCVSEIKNVMVRMSREHFWRQEICFALSLLLCQLGGCEFVILEGLSNESFCLDGICAPYELVVAPTVYSEIRENNVKTVCEAIKRGVREVISGNQRSGVYSEISSACMMAGARLDVTAKPTMCVSKTTARRIEFSYAERDGFVLKSPSNIVRDCAMLTIEAALALRRGGVKMPWASISAGLESCNNTGCFDILSISPAVIVDSASSQEEITSVVETFDQTVEESKAITVCIMTESADSLAHQLLAFDGKNIERLIVCGISEDDAKRVSSVCPDVTACEKVSVAAKLVHSAMMARSTVFCLGSVAFSREIKTEFIKLMGL